MQECLQIFVGAALVANNPAGDDDFAAKAAHADDKTLCTWRYFDEEHV